MVLLKGSMKINVGGMSRGGGGKACAKRVAPPAVPADALPHRLSGSSFGSQGYASCDDPPPDTPSLARDDHSDYGSTVSGASGSSSGGGGCAGRSPGAFSFPAVGGTRYQSAEEQDAGVDVSCACSPDGAGAGAGAGVDVRALLGAGVPDAAVLEAWLRALRLPQYASLLTEAGYDVPTAARMTPEDLTAVGVRKPQHRRRLKQELAALALPDPLPCRLPGSLEEWLQLLRLEEYGPALAAQGYRTVRDVTQLAWEDLEDLGIVRLGHQKKMMLAIKRVKDILAGKLIPMSHTSQLRPFRGKSLESLESLEEERDWRRPSVCEHCGPHDAGTLPRHRPQGRSRPVAAVHPVGSVHPATGPPPDDRETRVLVHDPPLPLPACPSSESLSLSVSLEGVLPPPPPAPASPPPPAHHAHAPPRHHSDGSFQSSSSTESDSLPFANDNAGTMKPPRPRPAPPPRAPPPAHPAHHNDVLSDIGNMLATLTDELDAMLEEEKRHALAHPH